MNGCATSMLETLSLRERYRDDYRRTRDPICEDRLLWRAQTFRHLIHLMPGQSDLELGAETACSRGSSFACLAGKTR